MATISLTNSIFTKLNDEELLLINELYLEMKKYKNIIDELEKYIEENIKITKQALKFEQLDEIDKKKYNRDILLFEMVLDKLKELKGESN